MRIFDVILITRILAIRLKPSCNYKVNHKMAIERDFITVRLNGPEYARLGKGAKECKIKLTKMISNLIK